MEPAPLFVNKKEIILTVVVMLFLFCISLGLEFYSYQKLISKPVQKTDAKVLNHYEKQKKNGRTYDVFKLKSEDGYTFYTVTWKKSDIQIGSFIKVKFKTNKISFLDYLKNFFAVNLKIVSLKNKSSGSLKKIKEYIANQHKLKDLKEVFSALFFADFIQKTTRGKIQKLGIAHLVAISGFHLGLISAILYFLLAPIYRFFQDRFFPYRNIKADLAIVVFSFLFYYMYIIDFSPSFLRSFVLSVFGFFLFSKNIKIISFGTLFLSVSFILILFPKLLFSVSFWFSVSGVFYIFLFLKHFLGLSKIWIFVLLNFWVFVMMMPIVHFVFKTFTFLQLLSPFLSMAFVVFYPLELFLHVLGFGGVFDVWLEKLLNLQTTFYVILTPLWFLVPYVFLSVASIFNKWLALFVFLLSFSIYLI
ncbi:MAG: ComEC/Rec2 family competence protein [Epsilonproteobacteria bacterium]|nr:ComEC/Rec2 family competence protein [Campylobacterota bacterium]